MKKKEARLFIIILNQKFKKMKIPFGTISIPEESKDLIKQILDSKRVSSGKYVREFEERFAKLVGTKTAVAVSSAEQTPTLWL